MSGGLQDETQVKILLRWSIVVNVAILLSSFVAAECVMVVFAENWTRTILFGANSFVFVSEALVVSYVLTSLICNIDAHLSAIAAVKLTVSKCDSARDQVSVIKQDLTSSVKAPSPAWSGPASAPSPPPVSTASSSSPRRVSLDTPKDQEDPLLAVRRRAYELRWILLLFLLLGLAYHAYLLENNIAHPSDPLDPPPGLLSADNVPPFFMKGFMQTLAPLIQCASWSVLNWYMLSALGPSSSSSSSSHASSPSPPASGAVIVNVNVAVAVAPLPAVLLRNHPVDVSASSSTNHAC